MLDIYRWSGRVASATTLAVLYAGCVGERPSEPVRGAASAVGETCITVQRGTSGAVEDALIRSDKPANNYGASASLTASTDANATRHALIAWDVAAVPAGATVTTASATLKVLLQGGAIVDAHRVTQAWSEGTVTWGTAPSSVATAAASFPAASGGQTTTADVTALVQGWVDGTYPNYGILVERDASSGMTVFASSEDATVSNRPLLAVCYTLPVSCEGGCTPIDDCHDAACDTEIGQCVQTPKADGTACDDGNASTSNDVCQSGVCAGTVAEAWVVWGSSTDGACATKAGVLKCWGKNQKGILGLGDTANRGDNPGEMGNNLPAVDLGTGRTAVAAAAGYYDTCALLDNGQVKCWGTNGSGWLGLGDYNDRGDNPGEMGDNLSAIQLGTGRTAVAISAGGGHRCAILDNDQVKCWGYNYYGQLGLGDTVGRGETLAQMGDNLPAVDLGTGRHAIAISAGSNHTCALLDNHLVKCWGTNYFGQLGLDGYGKGDVPGTMGDNLPYTNLGTGRTAVTISASLGYTCALLDNGQIKCWGANYSGQLGLGHTTNLGLASHQMGDNLPAVDLGTGRTALALSTDSGGACALLDNHQVKCWGYNISGDLGLGDTVTRGDNPGEMGDNLPYVDLGTGRTANWLAGGCAGLDNGQIKCWGWGGYGRLGLGSFQSRGDQPGEMGDNLPALDLGN